MEVDGAVGPGSFASRRKPGFVADPHALVVPAPGDKGTFSKLGKNSLFEANPSVLHFGGFTLGKVHEQTLKIINISSKSQRLHVMAPTTPYFRMEYDNKKGLIPPGLAEEVKVFFAPTEFRYYYDCIRVRCEQQESMLIPMHAYPAINEFHFPSRVDFGVCMLGETVTRVIPLECKVPIQFAFEFKTVESHPDITVSPAKGIIPASGSVDITIQFRPASLSVAAAEVELSVAQFEFKPIRCAIIGSSAAGLARERELAVASRKLHETVAALPASPGQGTLTQKHAETVLTRTADVSHVVKSTLRSKGAGAAFDPGTTLLDDKLDKAKQGQAKREADWKATVSRIESDWAEGIVVEEGGGGDGAGYSTVDGVRVPENLSGTAAVTFMLTQRKGALKPKDLAVAIAKKQLERTRQDIEQARIRESQGGAARSAAGVGLTVDSLIAHERGGLPAGIVSTMASYSGLSPEEIEALEAASDDNGDESDGSVDLENEPLRKLREAVLVQDVVDIDKAERSREFQGRGDWLGETRMAGEQMDAVVNARFVVRDTLAAYQRRVDRRRRYTASRGPFQTPPVRAVVAAHALPLAQPQFDTDTNDLWKMRKQALLRLKALVRKDIVRQRAAVRLAALRNKIAGIADQGKHAVKAFIDEDHRQATSGAGGESAVAGEADTWLIPGLKIAPPPVVNRVPLLRPADDAESSSSARKQVPVEVPRGFWRQEKLAVPVPPEARVMNYSAFPMPPAPMYVPPEKLRSMRAGAAEERPVPDMDVDVDARLRSGAAVAAWVPPVTCARPPAPAPSLQVDTLMPDPGFRSVVPLEPITEASLEYVLQARLAPPFSVAPPALPQVDDIGASAADSVDINGLLLSASQVYSTMLGTSSLRPLQAYPFLYDSYAPMTDRFDNNKFGLGNVEEVVGAYPAMTADAWSAPLLPALLPQALPDDHLSDDSESDTEDPDDKIHPRMSEAASLFASDAAAAGAGGQPWDAVGPAAVPRVLSEMARDRARLAMARKERAIGIEDARWLDRRLNDVDKLIVDPALAFNFDAI